MGGEARCSWWAGLGGGAKPACSLAERVGGQFGEEKAAERIRAALLLREPVTAPGRATWPEGSRV